MALGPAKLTDLDDPLRGPQATAPGAASPERAPRSQRDAKRKDGRGKPAPAPSNMARTAGDPGSRTTDESIGDPYAGSPKITVNMRATKELWDRLGALSRELEAQEFRTSRTELTEALWHFHAPRDAAGARELIRRYRRSRLGD
jgi:hypothetical protein